MAVTAAAQRRTPTEPRRANDDILLLGLNQGAESEAKGLRERGAKVTLIKDSFESGKVKTTGADRRPVTHDLNTEAGVGGFVKTLGLPAEQSDQISKVLQGADPRARDELGQLAQVWAKGEKGGAVPSRLMLSGHSTGGRIWGDGNGQVQFDEVGALAKAMPKAAAQVQDLHVAACYAGGERNMDKFRDMFPNLKTAWGYTGSAPGADSGAAAHQRRWEAATRGDRTDLSRNLANGTRKGENVATWTATRGYDDGKDRTSLSALRQAVDGREYTYNQHFQGLRDVQNPQQGPLRDYYNQVQRLIQHPELPAAERDALETKRDQAVRLMFYGSNVAPKFATEHAATIDAGYRAMGLTPPALGTMRRQDALASIADLESRVNAQGDAAPAAAKQLLPLLTRGLRDLDRSLIPEGWL